MNLTILVRTAMKTGKFKARRGEHNKYDKTASKVLVHNT